MPQTLAAGDPDWLESQIAGSRAGPARIDTMCPESPGSGVAEGPWREVRAQGGAQQEVRGTLGLALCICKLKKLSLGLF